MIIMGCTESKPTEPDDDETIVHFIDPNTCGYYISIYSSNEENLYRVELHDISGSHGVHSLTLDGSDIIFNEWSVAYVRLLPGLEYSGLFVYNEVEYPFTITIANELENVSWDGDYNTPSLNWQLDSPNMHQYVEGWYSASGGDSCFSQAIVATKTEYTFEDRPYIDVSIVTLNSFNSHNNSFGVYSWSGKYFDLNPWASVGPLLRWKANKGFGTGSINFHNSSNIIMDQKSPD